MEAPIGDLKCRRRKTKRHPHGKPTYIVRDMRWKDKYCSNLLFDVNKDPKKTAQDLDKIADEFKDLKSDLFSQTGHIAAGFVENYSHKFIGIFCFSKKDCFATAIRYFWEELFLGGITPAFGKDPALWYFLSGVGIICIKKAALSSA